MPAPVFPHYRQLTLANGLRVALRHAPRLKRCAASLRVEAGSHDAPLAWPGLAHFLEHLLFLATARFPADEGLMAYVQRHGGQINASTRERSTEFFFEVPVTAFAPGLERLADMLAHPRLAMDDQLREREVLQAEFVAWTQDETARRQQALFKGLAEAHPLRGFHAGNRESLPVEREDFQQALKGFYREFYQTGQMTLSLAGPQSLETLQSLAEQFGDLIPPGPHQEQHRAPALLAGDQRTFTHTCGRHWHQLITGAASPAALDFLCTWLNLQAPGGLLARLQANQWASALKATPLYQFDDQALLDIDVTLSTEDSQPVSELLHDWLSFFAHSDWTPLLEEYALLIERQQQSLGALALARQADGHLSQADIQSLKVFLDALQLPPARHNWQLPTRNPFLQPVAKEQRAGLIRGQTSAHRGLRTFAQDRSRARKDLSALSVSPALADDTGEGAVYLRWRFDSSQHADFFPRVEHSLRPLTEQARQAGVDLCLDVAGNDWLLKLTGLHEPLPAVLEQVARHLTQPDETPWPPSSSDTPPTLAIRQLLKALPDYCSGSGPIEATPKASLAQLWSGARWQGLALGLPAQCATAVKGAASRLPGQAAADTPVPLPITGQRLYHRMATHAADAAVLLFCPTPSASLVDEARWRLLAHQVQTPFYQRLRVELQLGYAVFSGIRQFNGQTGLLFGVQSPTASVTEIVEHLQAFLSQLEISTCLTHALAGQFSAESLPMPQAAELLWQAHLAGHPADYLTQLQQAILSCTPQHMQDAVRHLNAATGGWHCLCNQPA